MKKDTQDIVMYNIFTIKKNVIHIRKKRIQKLTKNIWKHPFIAGIFA